MNIPRRNPAGMIRLTTGDRNNKYIASDHARNIRDPKGILLPKITIDASSIAQVSTFPKMPGSRQSQIPRAAIRDR